MLTTWCDFCAAQEFNGDIGQTPEFKRRFQHLLPSRVVYQSEHFIAIAGLGQITDGYILLLTREHFPSMAHLPSAAYYQELEQVHEYLVAVLSKLFVRPIVFEHGPMLSLNARGMTCEGGGSCMDHAHLHFFPVPIVTNQILSHLQVQHAHYPITQYRELQRQKKRAMPYLFFETAQGKRWVFDAPSVPSQYLRRIVAETMNVPDKWNWHLYPQPERIKTTVERFHSQK